MLTSTIEYSPTSAVMAKVELYEGSTLVNTVTCSDLIQSFTVSRIGDMSKFFGFGVCHRLTLKLLDFDNTLNISTANTLKIYFGNGNEWDKAFPDFRVSEVRRDETHEVLSITAYDAINASSVPLVSELNLTPPYTIRAVTEAIASFLGLSVVIDDLAATLFDRNFETGANLGGKETLREVLDDIAEVTQTVYFINNNNELVFKRPDKDAEPDFRITKAAYYSLDTETNRRLAVICSATELGNNIEASLTVNGTTQYIRDNVFWTALDDTTVGAEVDAALAAVGGLTINQFVCNWDGNYLLEPVDKIAIETDTEDVITYLYGDTITYAGYIEAKTEWEYTAEEETAANPSSLGDKLKQTYAKVDKANQQIELVVNDVSQIKLTNDSIDASVKAIENKTSQKFDSLSTEVESLTKEVSLKLTADDLSIEVNKQLENGVDRVVTSSKRYTFDDTGLNISSSESAISTKVTEDGMTIKRGYNEVLVANNEGVKAEDLHATTYLIIGETSRLEDYKNRTSCFWIGG